MITQQRTAEEQTMMANTLAAMAALSGNKHSLTPEGGWLFLQLWGMASQQVQPAESESASPAPAPDESEKMPELALLPDALEPTEKEGWQPPAVIKSQEKHWLAGYNWRIDVVPFDRDCYDQSYFVHCAERPTQELFNEHYVLYQEHKCKVHVMESNGVASRRITDEYCSFREKHAENFTSKEDLKPNDEWPDGMRFRIRFYDPRIFRSNYRYYANKPSAQEVNEVTCAKHCAIVESRPLSLVNGAAA